MMRWLSIALGQFYYRFLTEENFRWYVGAGITVGLMLCTVLLLPFMLERPPSELDAIRAEYYRFSALGSDPGIQIVAPSPLRRFLGVTGMVLAGLTVLVGFAISVYTFPAFGDEGREILHRVRARMHARYGAEAIHHQSWLTRRLLGFRQPALGTTQRATPGAAAQTPPPAATAAERPLTTTRFIFWEAVVDLATELLSDLFRRRRI